MEKASDLLKGKSKVYTSLENAYDGALKDESFKILVSKLKIQREKLINYTSTLEECAKEYHNCQHCPGILACKNKIKGYAYLPRVIDNVLEFSYRPCKYKIKLDK